MNIFKKNTFYKYSILSTTNQFVVQKQFQKLNPIYFTRTFCKDNTTATKKNSFSIALFGSDDVSVETLDALLNHMKQKNKNNSFEINDLMVVCAPDKKFRKDIKFGKNILKEGITVKIIHFKVETKEWAISNNIKYFQPDFGIEFKNWQLPIKFDIGIACSFGHLIPPHHINCAKKGMINMHPSLLPKYRGASPIQFTVLNSETKTGVSIITLHQEFDKGKLLLQTSHEIGFESTYEQLRKELSSLGAKCVINTLSKFDYYWENAKHILDDSYDCTYAPKIKNFMSQVNFEEMNQKKIFALWLTFGGNMGCYSYFQHPLTQSIFKVKFLNIIIPDKSNQQILQFLSKQKKRKVEGGDIFFENDSILIKCGGEKQNYQEEEYIQCFSLQIEGKKPMSAKDFYNGYFKNSAKIKKDFHQFFFQQEAK